jgi:hypothetical protein
VAFWQYEAAMDGKVGEILPTIVIFKETGITQLPADNGVNVYVVVPSAEVLMLAGLQVPAIPSFDVDGRDGGVEFWQSGPMASNMGEKLLTTEMLKETGAAQFPADGVNIYVAVPRADVLMLAGFHVPGTPSADVAGSAGAAAFWQYELAMVGKVGEIFPTTDMLKEAAVAQLPADDGVKW